MKLSSVILLFLFFVLLICFSKNNTLEGHSDMQCHDHITFSGSGIPPISPMVRVRQCTEIESDNGIIHDLLLNIHLTSMEDTNITFAERLGASMNDNSSMQFYVDGPSGSSIIITDDGTFSNENQLSFNYNEFGESASYDDLGESTTRKIEAILDYMAEKSDITFTSELQSLEQGLDETEDDLSSTGSRLVSSTEGELTNTTYEDIISGNISNIPNDLEKVLKDNFVLPYMDKSKKIVCDHLPNSILNDKCIPDNISLIADHMCNGSFEQTINFVNENICDNTKYDDFKQEIMYIIQKLEDNLETYIQKIESLFNLIKNKVVMTRNFNQDLDELGAPEVSNVLNQTLQYYDQLKTTVNEIEFFDSSSIPPDLQERLNALINGINSTFTEVTDRFDSMFPDGSDSLTIKDFINDTLDDIGDNEYPSLVNEEYQNIHSMIQSINIMSRYIQTLINSINDIVVLFNTKICGNNNDELKNLKSTTCAKVEKMINKLNYECCSTMTDAIRENCDQSTTQNMPTCDDRLNMPISPLIDDPFVTSFLPNGNVYSSLNNFGDQFSTIGDEINQLIP